MKTVVLVSVVTVVSGQISTTEAAPVREEWAARYNGLGNQADGAEAIALDAEGNVYVTGFTWVGSSPSYDYATIKYGPTGNQLWVTQYDGTTNGSDHAQAMAHDGEGNVYATGESYGYASDTDANDYATIKYDTDGNELWVARYNGPGNGYDGAKAIALDSSGNVYVTGTSEGATGFNYATIKYGACGNELWVARYDSGRANTFHFAKALTLYPLPNT